MTFNVVGFDRMQISHRHCSLLFRHNGSNGVSNHQLHDCLLNRSFRYRSNKTPKLRVTGLCTGIYRWLVNSPHKWPVTRKMFPFDGMIMTLSCGPLLYDYLEFSMWRQISYRILILVKCIFPKILVKYIDSGKTDILLQLQTFLLVPLSIKAWHNVLQKYNPGIACKNEVFIYTRKVHGT